MRDATARYAIVLVAAPLEVHGAVLLVSYLGAAGIISIILQYVMLRHQRCITLPVRL